MEILQERVQARERFRLLARQLLLFRGSAHIRGNNVVVALQHRVRIEPALVQEPRKLQRTDHLGVFERHAPARPCQGPFRQMGDEILPYSGARRAGLTGRGRAEFLLFSDMKTAVIDLPDPDMRRRRVGHYLRNPSCGADLRCGESAPAPPVQARQGT